MPFNLIHEAWLPVRRAGGERLWIKPADLTNDICGDPIVALDFPRPDWNAAVTEFLIGLFTCALAPEDDRQWAAHWKAPPPPEQLAGKLERLAFAFNLDGDGARCFQDIDLPETSARKDVSKLLVDGPSANALVNNTDFFNKRDVITGICSPYAAAAVIALQTYAPYDSSKHVASIRSFGALTTLVRPLSPFVCLWFRIWANSPNIPEDGLPFGQPPTHPAWARVFPWLVSTKTFGKSNTCGPDNGHVPLMCFFAMPRRIRLVFAAVQESRCSLGGPSSGFLVEEFLSDTYGPNYFGWRHPLSPYFDTAAGGFAAVKADDITCHYRDWLSVWGGRERQYPSEIVVTWRNRVNRLRAEAKNIPTFVDAFGFVFKQAQPRAWTEIIAPLFVMEDDKYTRFLLTVKWLIDGAEEASRALRTQIKVARFAVRDSEGTYKFTDSQRSTETGDNQVELFWRVTETRFRNILNNLAGLPDPSDEDQRIRKNWLNYIRREALRIFDEDIAPNEAWSEDPKRLVYARSSLTNAFIENNKVWKALGLPPPLKTKKNGRKVDGEAARP